MRRVTENVCGKFLYALVRIKLAVSQFSRARLPGTKAAISPEKNGLSVPNFEQACENSRQRGIR